MYRQVRCITPGQFKHAQIRNDQAIRPQLLQPLKKSRHLQQIPVCWINIGRQIKLFPVLMTKTDGFFQPRFIKIFTGSAQSEGTVSRINRIGPIPDRIAEFLKITRGRKQLHAQETVPVPRGASPAFFKFFR